MLQALDVAAFEVYSDSSFSDTPSPSGILMNGSADVRDFDSDLGMDSLSRVRMVHFQKNTDEAMVKMICLYRFNVMLCNTK